MLDSPRLQREWKTVTIMIQMYCNHNHNNDEIVLTNSEVNKHNKQLCIQCNELLNYVNYKMKNCRFINNKPTCANCPIHCYRKSFREEIRKVMRFSGPRMMFRHPILTLRHVFDGRKEVLI